MISDRDNDCKVIKWGTIFMACLCRTYGTTGLLLYVLHEKSDVPAEIYDPLENNNYVSSSGSLHDRLVARLPHVGPIFTHDNASVFVKIKKVSRERTVESTVKYFLAPRMNIRHI